MAFADHDPVSSNPSDYGYSLFTDQSIEVADNDLFSNRNLKQIETLEALPLLDAFAHLMYEHRLSRETSFIANGELVISKDDLEGELPNEFFERFDWLFANNEVAIDELQITQTEKFIDDKPQTILDLSFNETESGSGYKLVSDGAAAKKILTNSSGDKIVYNDITPDDVSNLMKLFLLGYTDTKGCDYSLAEDVLPDILRDYWTRENEQIIRTFGDFGGAACTTTESLFPTDDGSSFIVKLANRETPITSQAGTDFRIDLWSNEETRRLLQLNTAFRSSHDDSKLSQKLFKSDMTCLEKKEVIPKTIDGEVNPEWVNDCLDFMDLISPLLKKWDYLDGTPDEILFGDCGTQDFPDPSDFSG